MTSSNEREDPISQQTTGEHHTPQPYPAVRIPHPFSSLLQVDVAALTHPGKVRRDNEDHFFVARVHRSLEPIATNVPDDLLLDAYEETGYGMIVADGMGGHAAGEVASRMAIIHLLTLIVTTPDWIMRMDDDQEDRLTQRFIERYRDVDTALKEDIKRDPSLKGMGTTMTVSYSVGNDLFVGHIGDSRAYLVRGGKLQQLTRDQTLAQRLIDSHGLRREETATLKLRHILTAALGATPDQVDAEVRRLRLADGDQVLLCTDGLTEMLDDNAIELALAGAASSEAACRDLIELALDHGGKDNVTVALARYRFPKQA